MTKTNKRLIQLAILTGLLLIIGWFALKTWRIAQAGQSLLNRQAEVEALMSAGDLTAINPDEAEKLLLGVRQDIVTIKEESAPFMFLTPYLGWVPEAGPLIVASPHLLEMADAGTAAAAFSLRGLKPAIVLIQNETTPNTDRMARLVQIIDEAEPDLIQAEIALERVAAARRQLGDVSQLPWRVQTLLQPLDEWLPLGLEGIKIAQVLPEIMGIGGSKQYLIVAQNEDELRATGGFISGAGVMTMADGRIADLNFQDAYQVDDWRNKPYDFPPQPLYDFMGLELFLFRDANFWPDFPTSAETVLDLYSYGQEIPPLDGMIAIDQRFLQMLIRAIGPISVPDEDQPVTQGNIIATLRESWGIQEGQEVGQWVANRKQFFGVFADAIRVRVEASLGEIDPILLTQTMRDAIKGKHLQLYMRDPAVMAVLDEVNWDGRVPPLTGQDQLMVVDTNMGYNKANIHVSRSLSYTVALDSSGSAQADLLLTYRHHAPDNGRPCSQATASEYADAPQYLDLANRCYWNYLRVYAPAGSRLTDADRHPAPADYFVTDRAWNQPAAVHTDAAGLTIFTNFFVLPRAQTLESRYAYQLPNVVTTDDDGAAAYHLTLHKQAGAVPHPAQIVVQLPDGAEFVEAAPAPTAVADSTIRFDTTTNADLEFVVVYQLP